MNTLPVPASVPVHFPRTSSHSSGTAAGVALLVATLVLFSGCATSPLDRAAKSLAATVASVDVAMQGFTTADALGRVSAHDQTQVRKLYADYQAAESVVETALLNALKTRDAGGLASATAALDASKMDLLKFLARFTTSPPTP